MSETKKRNRYVAFSAMKYSRTKSLKRTTPSMRRCLNALLSCDRGRQAQQRRQALAHHAVGVIARDLGEKIDAAQLDQLRHDAEGARLLPGGGGDQHPDEGVEDAALLEHLHRLLRGVGVVGVQ